MNLNTVTLAGILKSMDPPKVSDKGTVLDAVIAVAGKDRDGNPNEEAIKFVAFNKTAEALLAMSPGQQIHIQARIGVSEREYEGNTIRTQQIKATLVLIKAEPPIIGA